MVVSKNKDWDSAWHYCQAHRGSLVAIRSAEQQHALSAYLSRLHGQ